MLYFSRQLRLAKNSVPGGMETVGDNCQGVEDLAAQDTNHRITRCGTDLSTHAAASVPLVTDDSGRNNASSRVLPPIGVS